MYYFVLLEVLMWFPYLDGTLTDIKLIIHILNVYITNLPEYFLNTPREEKLAFAFSFFKNFLQDFITTFHID